ncbi:MAG: AI-2E family transporter, partial [Candidatus Eremiobacteraeota bacterium]|nr:AI-2E family transporter [Candidatus Eremiobacteraeota bacterium]
MIASSGAPINWRLVGRYALIAIGIGVFLYVLSLIPKTVEVFVIAILVAYALAPIVRGLQRRMPRAVAIVVVYTALVLLTAAFFLLLIPATYDQFQLVLANAPAYIDAARNFIDAAQVYLKQHLGPLIATNQISQIEAANMDKLSSAVEAGFGSLSLLVLGIGNAIVIVIFGVTLSYFLLANSDAIRDSFYSLFPDRLQSHARYFSREVARVVGGFIIGQLILVAITFLLTYIALLIMHQPFALLLSVIAGVCYAIPYVGVVISTVLGFLLGALQGWPTGVIVALIIVVTSKVSDFLVPKVMGDSVGVSPIAIIFAVFAGGELFGLWGLLLGIPAAALFKVIWMLWLHPWLTGRPVVIPDVPDATEPAPAAKPAVP